MFKIFAQNSIFPESRVLLQGKAPKVEKLMFVYKYTGKKNWTVVFKKVFNEKVCCVREKGCRHCPPSLPFSSPVSRKQNIQIRVEKLCSQYRLEIMKISRKKRKYISERGLVKKK